MNADADASAHIYAHAKLPGMAAPPPPPLTGGTDDDTFPPTAPLQTGGGYKFPHTRNALTVETMPPSGVGVYASAVKKTAAAVGRAVKGLRDFARNLPRHLVSTKEVLVAVLVIALVTAILALAVVLFRYFHPRIVSVSRSADFERYMDEHIAEVEDHVFSLRTGPAWDALTRTVFSMPPKAARVLKCARDADADAETGDAAACVLAEQAGAMRDALDVLTARGRERFREDLRVHYRMFNTITRLEKPVHRFFARRNIVNEPRFSRKGPDGELQEVMDDDAVDEFVRTFREPMRRLGENVGSASAELSTWTGMYAQPWYDDAVFRGVSAVHLLNLLLNDYHEQIAFSYDTRRALTLTLQFNVWTLYYVPYAEKTFTVRIPAIWQRFPDLREAQTAAFRAGWEWLGRMVRSLPLQLAKQAEYDSFVNSDAGADAAAKNADTVEGFGFLKGLLSVGEFFAKLLQTAIIVARLVTQLVSDPFRAVLFPIFVVMAAVIGLALTLLHALLTMTGVSYLLGLVWGLLAALTVMLLLTAVEVVFVLIITVVFAVLWFVDLLTGGMVVRLMRCENLPNEWERRGNYAEGNKATRYFGTACCYPCASRFKPEYGALCRRVHGYIPDYCPQQQIVTAFRRGHTMGGGYFSGPVLFRDLAGLKPELLNKSRAERRAILLAAFARAREYLKNCYGTMARYDYVNKHACANIDRLPPERYSDSTKAHLKQACAQAYCEFGRAEGGGVRYRDPAETREDCLCRGIATSAVPADAGKNDENPDDAETGTTRFFARPRAPTHPTAIGRKALLVVVSAVALSAAVHSLATAASRMQTVQRNALARAPAA